MSTGHGESTPLELRAQVLLEESVTHIDGRVRSRLNQARQAALAQFDDPRAARYRNRAFVPVGVAASIAVALVAFVALRNTPQSVPGTETAQATFEDIDLLADGEALDLVEDDGAFYEWAVAEG